MRTQKILLSLGMIVFVGALAAGATGAFFSDTETSTGNTFAAGEIDLKVDNSSYGFDWNRPGAVNPTGVWGPNAANSWVLSDLTNQLFFSFADLKPGDYGEDTISLHVQNNAYACMRMALASTTENLVNEPESKVPDLTVGANEGELQNYLSFMFWNDDGDNVYEVGETIIPGLTGLPGAIFTGNWLTIADSAGGIQLAAGTTTYIGKGWCFGTMTATPATPAANPNGPTPGNTGFTCSGAGDHNIAQTDGISVDVGFYSIQSRNNGQFVCSSLNQTTEPETATVTVDKVVSFTSVTIDGVTVSDFALTIDGPGAPLGVVDEVATAGLPVGTYSISEVYSGVPANVTFNASFSGGCSEVGDTGVGTMNVVAGVNPTCVITNAVSPVPVPEA